MGADPFCVGVGSHQRLVGHFRHIPKEFWAGMGQVDEDARLFQQRDSLAAQVGKACVARGQHPPSQLCFPVPGEGAHAHAQAPKVLDALQPAA